MGWTVLYIAFGVVALWLLGEVLLQYKARLRWRLLAFVGFLGVVVGVLIPSVVVIGLGAAAFAVGQTYVTLSFRRGFASGWAVTGRPAPGAGKRNRRGREEPTLEVSDLQAADYADGTERDDTGSYGDDLDRDDVFTPARSAASAAESTAVYEPQPLPDDTGSYGIYGETGHAGGDRSQDQYAATAQTADQGYAYDGYSGYGQQYGYDATGQQQYAAYSDPYIGTQTYSGVAYDPAYDQHAYGQQAYGQDQYASGYGGETPSGGVWVPQQRTTDDPYGGDLPPEQPYPYQGDGQAQGYDERYRF
ncbi:SCO2102 family sporulation regulator [Streptomyces sp. NPDC001595]|uniref:SCO2102 family sporulation regulator n=1 Tax=Streptomyces sp. NPDC001532 TaxID=3154520 RepID=UPI00332DF442